MMDIKSIKQQLSRNPLFVYAALGVMVIVILFFSVMGQNQERKHDIKESKKSSIGLSVGRVDEQAYISRLEKNYYEFEDRVKGVEDQVKRFSKDLSDFKKSQRELNKGVKNIEKHLDVMIDERLSQNTAASLTQEQNMELAIAHIKPIDANETDVYLPMGSFCKGTLLTGVYAASDINNPLPVLISLDEAFFGPNNTRIPLQGAFILGKAIGDLVSSRALIQIVAISMVLPDERAFEYTENIGYITDQFGELGIQGQIIRSTGKALVLSFMGGFLSGGAQALADQDVSVSDTAYGSVKRELTGDTTRHAVFSGLAKSASRMSDYYEKQAEQLVPAVHIPSGRQVYFIAQKGVRINGLSRAAHVPAMPHN